MRAWSLCHLWLIQLLLWVGHALSSKTVLSYLVGTQLNLFHLYFAACSANLFLLSCRRQPFLILMLFDLCGFIFTWWQEEELIILYIH